jgi:hypothetical protein
MQTPKDLTAVQNIIRALLKTRKNFRIYPSNNPIYHRSIEECFERFASFFTDMDKLVFYIRRSEIYYNNIPVYQNSTINDDNLAFLFFKDGIRELTFKKNMPIKELKAFLNVISFDFEKDNLDDDIVTLLWEKDFSFIRYIIDDEFLTDEDYETQAVAQVRKQPTQSDAFSGEYQYELKLSKKNSSDFISAITDKDLQMLSKELKEDAADKFDKFANILFELFYSTRRRQEFSDLEESFKNTIEYAVKSQHIREITNILIKLNLILKNTRTSQPIKKHIRNIINYMGRKELIDLIGGQLDATKINEIKPYQDLIEYYDANAIPFLMYLLQQLNTIHARRVVIDGIVLLGPKNISAVIEGLQNEKWYVVRNTVHILRKIGDKTVLPHILKVSDHTDIRVRKEVAQALGELCNPDAINTLRRYLDDPELQIRTTALRALGNFHFEKSKICILEKMAESGFDHKELDEKKVFFEILSRWKDKDIYDFMIQMLKPRKMMSGAKYYENRACAAHGLGCMGNPDALKYLSKNINSKNKLLREYSNSAIKRIGDDKS